jgi:membrane-associated phospholipid phosphatase
MPPTSIDLALATWLHAHATPGLTQVMLFVTNSHSNLAIDIMSAAIALVLWRARERVWAITLLAVVPAGLAVNVLLKHAFGRARPAFEDPLLTLDTYSFPSGHVAGATLFYGFLVAYFWRRLPNAAMRAAAIAAAAAMVCVVALTRMYLGAHYLTDVLAAAAWSLAWLALCLHLRTRVAAR